MARSASKPRGRLHQAEVGDLLEVVERDARATGSGARHRRAICMLTSTTRSSRPLTFLVIGRHSPQAPAAARWPRVETAARDRVRQADRVDIRAVTRRRRLPRCAPFGAEVECGLTVWHGGQPLRNGLSLRLRFVHTPRGVGELPRGACLIRARPGRVRPPAVVRPRPGRRARRRPRTTTARSNRPLSQYGAPTRRDRSSSRCGPCACSARTIWPISWKTWRSRGPSVVAFGGGIGIGARSSFEWSPWIGQACAAAGRSPLSASSAVSGLAMLSSDWPSALTPRNDATMPPPIINPAPRK